MKKSILFCAALFVCALGFQSCDKVDNPGSPTEAVIENGSDLADVIAQFANDGVLNLPAGVELTLNKPVEFVKPITIVGDEKEPASIVFTSEDAGLIINGGLTLKNINFDCNASKAPFIQLSKNPAVNASKVNAWDTDYYFYLIADPIEVINCYVDGVNSFFLTDNKIENNGVWFPTTILVDNSIVRLSTPANSSSNAYFNLNNGGGFAKEMTVKNSTFYNTTDFGFRYFVRYGGFGIDQAKQAFGWEETGDPVWTDRMRTQWKYIREVTVDPREGSEWFNEILEDGTLVDEKPIVEEWKCPYHNGRMCLQLIQADLPDGI